MFSHTLKALDALLAGDEPQATQEDELCFFNKETVGVSWHCIDDVLMKLLFAVFFVLWVAWIILCEWVVGYHVTTF